ncbi:SMP-30/gluconolactonase/LRE family protein [Alphaproteobacteria bacterium]|nr:SMP-30/gluconolactonase/LRE family protein [Alphaproteobacteria bacterium]
MSKVEQIFKCNNILGEGITYSNLDENLFWLDISNKSKLYRLNLSSNKNFVYDLPEIVTATSIKSTNEIVLASNNGINLFNTETNIFKKQIGLEDNQLQTRSNDGASDALGRFWFGTMQNNFDINGNSIPITRNMGKLYKVDINKQVTVMEDDLGIPNTFVWSPDNSKFYFTDTLTGKIKSYDFNLQTGTLTNKQNFINIGRGLPDGSTIDTDGCLWNCRWGGSCIVRFTPDGKIDQFIEMPVQNVTNCVFGGSDMKTLFITTASNEDDGRTDMDGDLFAINLQYQGIEDHKSKIQFN